MSPSKSRIFRTVSQELRPSDDRSCYIAADGRRPCDGDGFGGILRASAAVLGVSFSFRICAGVLVVGGGGVRVWICRVWRFQMQALGGWVCKKVLPIHSYPEHFD